MTTHHEQVTADRHRAAAMALTAVDWCRLPTQELRDAVERLDDSTELYDQVRDEIAEREHEADVRRMNGGVLP